MHVAKRARCLVFSTVTGASIGGRSIPAGTIFGLSLTFVHSSDDVSTNATKFDPEHWIGIDAGTLGKGTVLFLNGLRACLGINLAKCELYLAFASIFWRFR